MSSTVVPGRRRRRRRARSLASWFVGGAGLDGVVLRVEQVVGPGDDVHAVLAVACSTGSGRSRRRRCAARGGRCRSRRAARRRCAAFPRRSPRARRRRSPSCPSASTTTPVRSSTFWFVTEYASAVAGEIQVVGAGHHPRRVGGGVGDGDPHDVAGGVAQVDPAAVGRAGGDAADRDACPTRSPTERRRRAWPWRRRDDDVRRDPGELVRRGGAARADDVGRQEQVERPRHHPRRERTAAARGDGDGVAGRVAQRQADGVVRRPAPRR